MDSNMDIILNSRIPDYELQDIKIDYTKNKIEIMISLYPKRL